MDPKFWHDVWDEGQIGFHQSEINKNLKKHLNLLQNTDHEILVPLCGKSLDMNYLISNKFKVYGVEIVKKALVQYLKEHKLNYHSKEISSEENEKFEAYITENDKLHLYHGDFHQFDKLGMKFNAIYDRASMIALPPEQREIHAQTLKNLTKKNGTILLITLEYDQSKVNGPPHSLETPEVERLFSNDFEITIINEEKTKNLGAKFKNNGINLVTQKVYCLKRK